MPKRSATPPVSDKPVIDQKFANYKLEVRPSAIHRWGVYAGENIRRRRKIIEYTGERISRKETKRRADNDPGLIYLFTLDKYWTLDGSVGGSGAEFINHCCDPNVFSEVRNGHILYLSKRDIKKGEELTIDYHFSKDVESHPCSCGAANCRGTLNVK